MVEGLGRAFGGAWGGAWRRVLLVLAMCGFAGLFLFGASVVRAEPMVATWYGPGLEGNPTASGETFDPSGYTAAHRTLPFGTRLIVTYGGASVVVRVNDRGPWTEGYDLDLSQAAAEYLGITAVGSATVDAVVADPATPVGPYSGGAPAQDEPPQDEPAQEPATEPVQEDARPSSGIEEAAPQQAAQQATPDATPQEAPARPEPVAPEDPEEPVATADAGPAAGATVEAPEAAEVVVGEATDSGDEARQAGRYAGLDQYAELDQYAAEQETVPEERVSGALAGLEAAAEDAEDEGSEFVRAAEAPETPAGDQAEPPASDEPAHPEHREPAEAPAPTRSEGGVPGLTVLPDTGGVPVGGLAAGAALVVLGMLVRRIWH